jgi:hypothetical protein
MTIQVLQLQYKRAHLTQLLALRSSNGELSQYSGGTLIEVPALVSLKSSVETPADSI